MYYSNTLNVHSYKEDERCSWYISVGDALWSEIGLLFDGPESFGYVPDSEDSSGEEPSQLGNCSSASSCSNGPTNYLVEGATKKIDWDEVESTQSSSNVRP